MDIEYLLFLQNLRESLPDYFSSLMVFVTKFAISPVLLWVLACLYWIWDKRSGAYIFLSVTCTDLFNQWIKLTACAYRPWIRDARIEPFGDSKIAATGYSFPSGHTQTITSLLGGSIVCYWKNHRGLCLFFVFWILLTGFSRNFLGVHTPQDVAVALIEVSFLLFIINRIRHWLDEHPDKDILVAVIAIAWALVSLLYFVYKPYPLDYVGDKLLVNPQKMMRDGFGASGIVCGAFLGWILERRFIQFKNESRRVYPYVLAVLSLGVFYYISTVLASQLQGIFDARWIGFTTRGLVYFYITGIMPLLLKICSKRFEKKA